MLQKSASEKKGLYFCLGSHRLILQSIKYYRFHMQFICYCCGQQRSTTLSLHINL